MLSIDKKELEDKMNTFLDVLNTNGEVNLEWITTKKHKFDSIYDETLNLIKRYNRNVGRLLRLIDNNKILTPQYIDEYDIEDVKDLILNKNEITEEQLDKIINHLSLMKDRVYKNIEDLDKILLEVSNKKGIYKINEAEADTFDEHYIDLDAMREEREIFFDDTHEVFFDDTNEDEITKDIEPTSSETFYSDDIPYIVNEDDIDYPLDGVKSIRDIARELFGDEKYWLYIYNFSPNEAVLKDALGVKKINPSMVEEHPEKLKGVVLKIPKEIMYYTESFGQDTLDEINKRR